MWGLQMSWKNYEAWPNNSNAICDNATKVWAGFGFICKFLQMARHFKNAFDSVQNEHGHLGNPNIDGNNFKIVLILFGSS